MDLCPFCSHMLIQQSISRQTHSHKVHYLDFLTIHYLLKVGPHPSELGEIDGLHDTSTQLRTGLVLHAGLDVSFHLSVG